jgi:hypothetical protein
MAEWGVMATIEALELNVRNLVNSVEKLPLALLTVV